MNEVKKHSIHQKSNADTHRHSAQAYTQLMQAQNECHLLCITRYIIISEGQAERQQTLWKPKEAKPGIAQMSQMITGTIIYQRFLFRLPAKGALSSTWE
jgi:hypothetical protein